MRWRFARERSTGTGPPTFASDAPRRVAWTPEMVDRFWTAFSKTRLTEHSFSRIAARTLVLAVRHHLQPTDRCLDFGAGGGDLVEALLGIDLQAAAVEPAEGRRRTIEARFMGKPGFLGVFPRDHGQQFDVVFAAEVIEHIVESEFDDTMTALANSLRPGGLMIVTTPNNEDLELGACICPTCGSHFHRWQHVRSFTPATLESALRRYRLEPIVTHVVEFNPAHFAPLEALDAGAAPETIADHLRSLRRDEAVRIGAESSILCLARRTGASSVLGGGMESGR